MAPIRTITLLLVISSLPAAVTAGRITDPGILTEGRQVFEQHCSSCHGARAQGLVEDWKKPGADGKYPPPPLNGTAHTWHHPFTQLRRVVKDGTARLGGNMPAWGGVLSDRQIDHTLHYIISLWPEEIFRNWEARGGYE